MAKKMTFSTPERAQLTSAGAPPDLIVAIEKALEKNAAVKAGTFDWAALIAGITKIVQDSPAVVADVVALFGIITTPPINLPGLFSGIVKIVSDAPKVVADVIALIQLIFPPAPTP